MIRPIRAVVVDDHPVVLSGLVALLSADTEIEVVGTAPDVAAATAIEPEVTPTVCIVDLRLPDGDGISLGLALKQRWGQAKVLMLTMDDDPAEILRALGAGLDGYVLKDAEPAELISAVRAVADGAVVLGRAASGPVVAAVSAAPDATPLARLDGREREILSLLVAGFSVNAIADRLHFAPKTIRNRLTQLTAKLGVTSRDEAIAVGIAGGLGEPG